MVSQLLFGEFVELGEQAGDFVYVTCVYDGYQGWCQRNQLRAIDTDNVVDTKAFTARFINEILVNGKAAVIPFGCPVYNADQSEFLFGPNAINGLHTGEGAWNSSEGFTEGRLRAAAFYFLNTAYLWGGKSVFGIDCSGFTQQVFKLLDVPLLRDAYLQAAQGDEVAKLSEAQVGDLAFFNNDQGRITHVGILLGADEIIHASGNVHVDKIDRDGIINTEGERTHRLHSIRRYKR
jgi:hypothetical protein